KEIETWRSFRHKNIVHFMGRIFYEDEFALVSKFYEKNMVEYLGNHPQTNPLMLLRGIAAGLDYLHSKNFVHGDVKGSNIMVSKTGRPLLADAGVAIVCGNLAASKGFQAPHERSSLRWAAPELFSKNPTENTRSPKSDVYAYASTALEIMTFEKPYYDLAEHQIMARVQEGRHHARPDMVARWSPTDELWNLFVSCWNKDRQRRPTMTEVITILSQFYSLSPDEIRESEAASLGSIPAWSV
ncbi:hypothetical protein M422DRAFT_196327, partial [Sphaerobolus stellatus SS14]